MAEQLVTVFNVTRNTVLGDKVGVAQSSLSRMVGLLGKSSLGPGSGLLIHPSQGVHTMGMRFPIDVIFLGRTGRVVHLCPAMRPYRLTGLHWKARTVLELPIGVIAESLTVIGDELKIQDEAQD